MDSIASRWHCTLTAGYDGRMMYSDLESIVAGVNASATGTGEASTE